jgi:hypothetical protein
LKYDIIDFQTLVPPVVWFFLLAAAIVMALWTYNQYQSIPSIWRWFLAGLRLIAFLVLLLLLSNPILQRVTEIIRKPVVAVLFDDSYSLSVEKGTWKGMSSLTELGEDLDAIDTSRVSLRRYAFGLDSDAVERFGMLEFDRTGTDIHSSLSQLQEYSNLDMYILITDGISTTGRDPLFAARNLTVPLHVIAVGDTSRQRDLILETVQYPTIGYTNSTIPLVANVVNQGFNDTSIDVELRQDGRLLERKQISTTTERSSHFVEFEVMFTESGLKSLQMIVIPVQGEYTEANNRQNFRIDIRDDKINILHLVFELHPDAGALRTVLADNPTFKLDERTWISGDRFLEGPLPNRADTLDLVIFHGTPRSPSSALNIIFEEYLQGTSILYFHTPGADQQFLSGILDGYLPVDINVSRNRLPVQIVPSSELSGHPVLDLPVIELARGPVLQSPLGGIQPKSQSISLLYSGMRGEILQTPLVSVQQTGNQRVSAFLGSGIYLWILQNDAQIRTWMEQLVTNLVNWTAADLAADRFVINSVRQQYNAGQDVAFQATVKDESGNLSADADIMVRVSSDDGFSRDFSMISTGSGLYSLAIPGLPDGDYVFDSKAVIQRIDIGDRTGSFSVGGSMIELIDLQRKDELLTSMARVTSGIFVTYEDTERLFNEIESISAVSSAEDVITAVYINRNPLWFILLLLVLTMEWLVRKKFALP